MLLSGRASDDIDERGRILYGDTLLLLLNGGSRSRLQVLPRLPSTGRWEQVLDTARPGHRIVRAATVNLTAHSLMLLRYDERFGGTTVRPASP
jgi:hypothetical protein